jgi:hypothetical protein
MSAMREELHQPVDQLPESDLRPADITDSGRQQLRATGFSP